MTEKNMYRFKEIRVFPDRTAYTPIDDMVCIGLPTEKFLEMDRNTEVLISVVFTWQIKEGRRLKRDWSRHFKNVRIGGPAISNYFDYKNGQFEPGRFVRPGVVFTSRGCMRSCPWCMVSRREGKLRLLEIKDGFLVDDSNLFSCGMKHIREVFKMLKKQNHSALLSGGIDTRIFNQEHLALLENISVGELCFSCDTEDNLPYLKNVSKILSLKPDSWKYVYCLVGFNEVLDTARIRVDRVRELGMIPIVLFFQPYTLDPPIKYLGGWLDLFYEKRPITLQSRIMSDWYPEGRKFFIQGKWVV